MIKARNRLTRRFVSSWDCWHRYEAYRAWCWRRTEHGKKKVAEYESSEPRVTARRAKQKQLHRERRQHEPGFAEAEKERLRQYRARKKAAPQNAAEQLAALLLDPVNDAAE